MNDTIIIYDQYHSEPAYEGTLEQCRAWLFGIANQFNCGQYRAWQDEGKYFYDVGYVYFCYFKLDEDKANE